MKIKSWNCTGLPNKLRNPAFKRWLGDADVACFQETFLDTGALQISGFQPFVSLATPAPAGKKHRATGGLVTLVSSSIGAIYSVSWIDSIICDGLESQCLLFERTDNSRVDLPASFLILNCYVVSHPRAFDFSVFYFMLEAFLLARDVPAVILGDFNAHLLVPGGSRLPSSRDRDFCEFVARMDDSGFACFPSTPSELRKPTYIATQGCSVIDYIFVRGVPCSGFQRTELTTFGHRGLQVDLEWPQFVVTGLRDRTSHRRHFKSDPPASFFPNFVRDHRLDSLVDFLKVGVARVFALFVLSVGQLFQVSRGHVGLVMEPWQRYLSSSELSPLLILEREVFGLAAGAQVGEPPIGLREKNSDLRRLRRSLHALATRRLFHEVKDSYTDPTRLWSFVRKFRVEQSQGVLPIDVLVCHFKSVFNRVSDPVPMVFCERDFEISDPETDEIFTLSELEAAFVGLDRGSAPGVTGIGNGVLTDLYRLPDGPYFFLNLFNACFLGGHLPDLWRCTEIFLLYKGKGDVGDPGSYRGIALMESILKLYERLLFGRLSRWAKLHDRIPDCQFGFRPRSSTLDAIFVLFTLLFKYVSVMGSPLFVCLIDFQKAFPSINRAQLLDKLGQMGVSARLRRAINSTFVGNTFAIRQGHQVTGEFPVTTGLREGSVLSPLLFILFVSDMCASVLHPFRIADYWKKDPMLNGVPIPGLLYADDLVLFCLNGDLLRERLRRLCNYADRNTLTVNVSKCEVVVFGKNVTPPSFKYKRQVIPVRQSCKYLGVWLDKDLSGRALAEAIEQKFRAATPVFFSLCRRLRLSRLDLVFRLASSLLFSLIYGCEFLRRLDVLEKCEEAWWRGVRSFYGLPNGVSSISLRFLFPNFSLIDRALLSKAGLLFRGTQPSSTLFPEAFVCDRGHLLARHRQGFSQIFKDWCQYLGLTEVFEADSMTGVRGLIVAARGRSLDAAWDTFCGMASTMHAASVFQSRSAFQAVLLEASRFGSLGVRAVLLSISGSLTVSYLRSRTCFCGVKFSFAHFLSCSLMGDCVSGRLERAIEVSDWHRSAVIILSRFEVFLHATRGGELSAEESDLFEALNEPVEPLES